MRYTRLLLIAGLASFIVGCGYVAPHLRVIEQGNKVEIEEIEQLRMGMSKDEVVDVIGAPILTSTFSPDRWEYVYDFREVKKAPITRSLILKFRDDRLVEINQPFQNADAAEL